MESEGIYRKSGSKTQTDAVKDMFQRGSEKEISDPEFDINAVASALKQYFRNLPTPLLTHDVYDKLLESTKLEPEKRIIALRHIMEELPPRHKDTLIFLIFHLSQVVKLADVNLMTSMNCGVVFAPTIMVGEDAQQDLHNTQQKNLLITFLIDNCDEIFCPGPLENGSV
jgi:Rho-type GTPase-activating protein 1/2